MYVRCKYMYVWIIKTTSECMYVCMYVCIVFVLSILNLYVYVYRVLYVS